MTRRVISRHCRRVWSIVSFGFDDDDEEEDDGHDNVAGAIGEETADADGAVDGGDATDDSGDANGAADAEGAAAGDSG